MKTNIPDVSSIVRLLTGFLSAETARNEAETALESARATLREHRNALVKAYRDGAAELKKTHAETGLTYQMVNVWHKAIADAAETAGANRRSVQNTLAKLRAWMKLPADPRADNGKGKGKGKGNGNAGKGTFTLRAAAAATVAALETLLAAHTADSAGRRFVADAIALVRKLAAERSA